jgi:hypothetical protein
MPVYTTGSGNNSLPSRTLEYLAKGASVGSRHNELFAAACQFRDYGYDLDETARQCVPRAIEDGLDEAEAAKTIASVFRHAPRGRPQKTGTASTTSSAGGGGAGPSEETAPPPPLTPEKLPDPIPDGLRVLVETLFKPGEGIAIGAGFKGVGGNLVIDRGVVRTWDRWQVALQKRSLERMNHAGNGLFFRINPMSRGGASDADENGRLISKEIQYALLLRSYLPIAALIDSGGKSLHAIVRIDAPDRAEYDRRVAQVFSRVPCVDTQNKNPSRYSRLPGISREEGLQQLLAVNLGALDWASFEGEIKHESPEERLLAPPWPVLGPAAYHGVLGRIARDIEPHSEADPAGILLQLLMMFGSTIGRRPFYAVEGTTHHCNLYSVLVGKTSQSRKGTSWGRAQQVFNTIQERPPIKGGLSSGEGLVDAVHDDIQKWVPGKKNSPGHFVIEKPAVADKRLFVSESEFGRVLVVMDREGNSLSQFLREAWETGNMGSMTKNNPMTATDAHVSICGQITRDELFARLKEVDVYNGLYNRFLWWCVRRSKTLPRGGESDIYKITNCLDDLKEVILWARGTGQLHRSEEAEEFWDKTYRELTRELSGVYGAMTSRAEAQVLRLSMIYSLADKSVEIAPDHLKAALAVWNYARDSVRYLFSRNSKMPRSSRLSRQ